MKGFAFSLQRVEQRFLSIRWRSHLPVLAGRVIGPSTSAARGLCPLLAQHYNVTALQTRSFSDLAQQDTVTGKSTPHVGKLSPREGVREALSMIQKSRDFKGAASLLTQIVSSKLRNDDGIMAVRGLSVIVTTHPPLCSQEAHTAVQELVQLWTTPGPPSTTTWKRCS